jgi:hypothetical protein
MHICCVQRDTAVAYHEGVQSHGLRMTAGPSACYFAGQPASSRYDTLGARVPYELFIHLHQFHISYFPSRPHVQSPNALSSAQRRDDRLTLMLRRGPQTLRHEECNNDLGEWFTVSE